MGELSKLGRYELRRVLGKGAMGVVYEGFDPSLNRRVAVKTILKSALTDQETAVAYSARFAREAKAAGRLNHPHIVQVYDFGDQKDVAYLVMEFIEGRELRSAFDARERFEPAEAVRVMVELLEALEFAHQAGVIHRDVKPANIMLDAQRRVKLADFGVARIQEGDLSKAGTMVGTPAFMSPEQITGSKIDRRSDVFSAGIVLYQLLTGELPFKGEGAWTVAKQIMQDEPARPSTIAGRLPPAYDLVVNRALAKKPDHRFSSAKEFAAALRGALAGSQGPDRTGSDAEIEFWRSIQGGSDPAEFEAYLLRFPDGVYADLARIKLAKLPPSSVSGDFTVRQPAPVPEAAELTALSQQTAELEAELVRREAEYRQREIAAEAAREAEVREQAEADAKREAELAARAAAEEKARLEAIEAARRESQAELARKEAEFRRREAEARARAEAEAKARAELEARVKKESEARAREQAETLRKSQEEADARKAQAAQERARREAEAAQREAEARQREAELKKKLAAAPKAKIPLLPIAVTLAVLIGAAGAWYWKISSDEARVAALTVALEAATRANEELDRARKSQVEAQARAASARTAEDEAKKSGDATALKAATDARVKAEAEAAAQAKLVQQREAEAKKADDAAKAADAKKQSEQAKAAEKAALEKAAAEKRAAEKAAREKAESERLAAEKAAHEKAEAEKVAAEKAAAEKTSVAKAAAPRPAPAASSGLALPKPGDRWVYSVRDVDIKDRTYEAALEVKAAGPKGVSYAFTPAVGAAVSRENGAGAHTITGVASGVSLLSPYMLSYEKLRQGDIGVEHETSACISQCRFVATVVGKERLSVPAGSFEAWKIVIRAITGSGSSAYRWEMTYWYDEATGMLVKYQRRTSPGSNLIGDNRTVATPDIDMELTAHVSAAAPPAAAASPSLALPSVGERWNYSVRDADIKDKVYEASLEVKAAGPKGVSYVFNRVGGVDITLEQIAGTHKINNLAPGVDLLPPYLLFYERLKPGDLQGVESDTGVCRISFCRFFPTVVGKEAVSTPAGSFGAVKIVVGAMGGGGAGGITPGRWELTYWYDEATGMLVKYRRRTKQSITGSGAGVTTPDIDMELLSHSGK